MMYPRAIPFYERDMVVLASKFAAAGAIIATLWESFGSVGQGIILVAGVFAAIGYIYAKLVRPLVGVIKRTYDAVESLEKLPELYGRVEAVEKELRQARDDRADIKAETAGIHQAIEERSKRR